MFSQTSFEPALGPRGGDVAHAGTITPEQPRHALLPASSSWRYRRHVRSRTTLVLAVLISGGLHAFLLFGIGHAKKAIPHRAPDENAIALTIAMPELKVLDEPEPPIGDAVGETPELGPPPPMQADLPQLPRPDDFVQQVDFASLLPRPDFGDAKVFTIPEHISRSGRRIAESIGSIFNLADLDRAPEPLLQMAPAYPTKLKKKGEEGTVRVEFVVDTRGNVVSATVVESSHHGFDDVTVATVLKWRFRPGVRGGRPVNVRMRVPIGFSLRDGLDAEI